MKYLLILFITFLTSCNNPNDKNIEEFSWNNGDLIYSDMGTWYVNSSDFIYPGDKDKIESFIEVFKNSEVYKINNNPGDLIDYYNIGSNKIGEFYFGLLTPGSTGRYVTSDNKLYFLEGDISNYQLNFDFRYKAFNFSSINSIYFHFKPAIEVYESDNISEVLKFDSESTSLLHNLIRLDIKDLEPGFNGQLIGELEIKLDNGSIETITIKKGANGILLNHRAPYSLLVSEKSFRDLINSF